MFLLQADPGPRLPIPPPAGAACDRVDVAALRLALAVRVRAVWPRPEFPGHRVLRARAAVLLSRLFTGAARAAWGVLGLAVLLPPPLSLAIRDARMPRSSRVRRSPSVADGAERTPPETGDESRSRDRGAMVVTGRARGEGDRARFEGELGRIGDLVGRTLRSSWRREPRVGDRSRAVSPPRRRPRPSDLGRGLRDGLSVSAPRGPRCEGRGGRSFGQVVGGRTPTGVPRPARRRVLRRRPGPPPSVR